MPIGIIADVIAVALGGLTGSFIGNKLNDSVKEKMTIALGVSAVAIGLVSIILVSNLPVVVLAMIAGTAIGIAIRLGSLIEKGAFKLSNLFRGSHVSRQNDFIATAIILFCASGTGIYGAMIEGISGDSSVLVSKSILDFATALIFACTAGPAVAAVAMPQAVFLLLFFFLSKLAYPLISPSMINDFRSCGGLITFVTGLKVAKVKEFPIADMLPAMVLVFFFSWGWTALFMH